MIAGAVSHARNLLSVAQEVADGKRPPFDNRVPLDQFNPGSVLHHACRIAEAKGSTDLSVIGLRGNDPVGVSPTIHRQFPYFGYMMLAGSGAPALATFLEERGRNYATVCASDDLRMRGYRVMHYVPMQLLNADRAFKSPTLAEGVGGFYEVLLNYKGTLEPDNVGWIRILSDLDETRLEAGLRIRAVWWHAYEGDDLIVMSAPDEDLYVAPGASVFLPVQRMRVDRFGPYTARRRNTRPSPKATALLRRIVSAPFRSFSLNLANEPRLLISTMSTQNVGWFRLSTARDGLHIILDGLEFALLVDDFKKGKLNPV
jgi:hypothetical protein